MSHPNPDPQDLIKGEVELEAGVDTLLEEFFKTQLGKDVRTLQEDQTITDEHYAEIFRGNFAQFLIERKEERQQ